MMNHQQIILIGSLLNKSEEEIRDAIQNPKDREDLLIEAMLKDVRERNMLELLSEEGRKDWENIPEKRTELYNEKKGKVDAERWETTLDSYKSYGCFPCPNYVIEGDYLTYKDKNTTIRIQADLLTNEDVINNNLLSEKKRESIKNAFCLISYTIGAFCPIWKNCGGRNGNGNIITSDTIWDKLENGGFENKLDEICIDKRNNPPQLTNRYKENLFMIFPYQDGIDATGVISKLYFQDYFDSNWKLLYPRKIINKINNEEELLEFLESTIILIVQRSYRIISGYGGNRLREQPDKKIIEGALSKIGLKSKECIYSNKRK